MSPRIKEFSAAYTANAAGILVAYPIDVVKSRIQTGAVWYRPTGIFRGVIPQLTLTGLSKTVRFVLYEELTGILHCSAWITGAMAGALSAITTTPLESHKVRRQLGIPFRLLTDSYRGFLPTLIREGVMTGCAFGISSSVD